MINDYIIRWKIKDLEEETTHLKVAIFKEVVDSLAKTFEFKIDEYQDSESNVSIESFIGQTEIMFYPKDRTFNLFYTDDIKDLDIGLVYKDKVTNLRLEEKFLYCIPYWMPFCFSSEDKKHEQNLINISLLTPNRPKLKGSDIIW
jgi:hypothetical protein